MSVTGLVLRVHDALYQRTDGRVGHGMIGVPTLILRTTGRRTGADQPPAWLHNLRANPAVEVQVGRERRKGTARIVEPSDPDYARLWQIVNENNRDRYNGYQRLTSRPIPVVVVSPS